MLAQRFCQNNLCTTQHAPQAVQVCCDTGRCIKITNQVPCCSAGSCSTLFTQSPAMRCQGQVLTWQSGPGAEHPRASSGHPQASSAAGAGCTGPVGSRPARHCLQSCLCWPAHHITCMIQVRRNLPQRCADSALAAGLGCLGSHMQLPHAEGSGRAVRISQVQSGQPCAQRRLGPWMLGMQ